MIRKLLTTTALAMVIATGAATAQNAPATTPMAPATLDGLLAQGYQSTESDSLATNIIGAGVYSSAAADADRIGEINNLVLDNGQVGAVIIGVGGFLGIGEKNVAVAYDALVWDEANERFTMNTTADQLAQAPDFVWTDDDAATDVAVTPAPGAPMTPTPADNMAAAPATPAPMTPATPAPADNNMAAAPVTPAPAAPVTPAPAENNMAAAPATPAPMAPADQPLQTAQEAAAPDAAPMTYDRSTMTVVERTALTADSLIGTDVIGPEDEVIAEVGDIILTPEGQVDALLVDFGGFLGIGQKRVAVGIDNLEFTTDANGAQYVWLNVTRDQLEAAPDYDEATWATTRDTQRMVINPA